MQAREDSLLARQTALGAKVESLSTMKQHYMSKMQTLN